MTKVRRKREKQLPPTVLECLPNETFVQIFSYLNGVDAFFAFTSLNNRFQSLLSEYCPYFNFKSISKAKFDLIFRRHDTQPWKSLQLFNDNDTPGQIEYFIENYFHVELFSQLQSLSISNIKSADTYRSLIYQLEFLPNLKSFKIESICGRTITKLILAKLKRLVLSSCKTTEWIKGCNKLESLEYSITNCCPCQAVLTWPLTLKRLKISFINDETIELVQRSLTNLSELVTLELYQKERGKSRPNGQIWEQIIRSSLPLLKSFKFYFQFKFPEYPHNTIERIIASFSTPFYLHEKNWFVRCDFAYFYPPHAVLYSLPFPFDQFTIINNSYRDSVTNLLKSESNDSYNNIYANVKTLQIEEMYSRLHKNYRKFQVTSLIIKTYLYSGDWPEILTKLHHLSFKSDIIMSSKQFRILLDNAPHLYSLEMEKSTLQCLTEGWENIYVCNHLSNQIRCLKLHSNNRRSECLTKYELHYIVKTFVSKCQHLSLSIQSKTDIIGSILRRMRQLRSLHVHIIDEIDLVITMEWLDQQRTKYNHSNCIIVKEKQDYYFWLGKHL